MAEIKLATEEEVAAAVGVYNKFLDDLKIEKIDLAGLMKRGAEAKKIMNALMDVHMKYTENMERRLNNG